MPPIVDVQIPHVRHKTLILWSLGKFQRCCGRYSAICVRIDEKSKFYVSETQTFQISAVWARPNTGFSTLDCKSHEVCNRNKQKWSAKTQVHANFDNRKARTWDLPCTTARFSFPFNKEIQTYHVLPPTHLPGNRNIETYHVLPLDIPSGTKKIETYHVPPPAFPS